MICFFHRACLDGLVAAHIVKQHTTVQGVYVPMDYNDPLPDFHNYKGKTVYIVDFSFPIDKMKELAQHAKEVIWLDHHKTAMEMRRDNKAFFDHTPNLRVILDNQFSGAGLAWKYFNPDKPFPSYIAHVQDRDLYRFKIIGTMEFHMFLQSLPMTFEAIDEVIAGINEHNRYKEYINIGGALLQSHKNNMEWALRFVHPIQIDGNVYYAVNGHRQTISELGSVLAQKHGIGVVYFIEGEKVKISLRSIKGNGHDVEVIANKFTGGGGHETAASFHTTLSEFTKMVYVKPAKKSLLDKAKSLL